MFCLFAVLCYPGVSCADGVESVLVSVMEGDSITLNPVLTDIQKNKLLYTFGAEGALIAHKDGNHISVNYDVSNEGFKGRLHLDQTGALTISDSKTSDSGVYELNIIGGREDQVKKFCVTIYPRLPAPDIIRTCPQNSSSSVSEHLEVSRCELLCSVVNVSAVSLSWYKGNSLLSSISVSDLSISLSLPLEVEHQDNNNYSCVVNNAIRNQTTHLDISQLCPDLPGQRTLIKTIGGVVVVALVLVSAVIYCLYKHCTTREVAGSQDQTSQNPQTGDGGQNETSQNPQTANPRERNQAEIESDPLITGSASSQESISLSTLCWK